MPWTGPNFVRENGPSPVFQGPNCWHSDADAAILIEADRHDFHDFDLAQGINACINKNGANSPGANIDWGGFKIVDLGYGSAIADAAAYGQVPIAASLDAGTNILTLTTADSTLSFGVDLTPLVVGGSTANFAKLNASDNVFTGQAEFGGTLSCTFGLNIQDPVTIGPPTWGLGPSSSQIFTIGNTSGAVLRFNGNAGAAQLQVNGSPVWTNATLTPATVAGILTVTSNPTITGSWNFTSGSIILPSTTTFAATGGAWSTSVNSAAWQLVSGATGDVFKLDHNVTEGMRGFVNGNRLWSAANMKVYASAVPTGGVANDIAFVQTGANTGVWSNIAGTWTKIAS